MKIKLFSVLIALCLTGCVAAKPVPKDIEVTHTPKGIMLTVSERLLFDSGKSTIKDDSKEVIGTIANIITNKTAADVLIEGHTDNIGSDRLNQKLSLARANAVKKVLMAKDVPSDRIRIIGHGKRKPKAENSTKDGRRLNRRTEIYLLGENDKEIVNEGVFAGSLVKLRNLFD